MMRSEGERLSEEEGGGGGDGNDGGMVTARGSPAYGGAGGGRESMAMAERQEESACLRLGSWPRSRAFYGFWGAGCVGVATGSYATPYCRRRQRSGDGNSEGKILAVSPSHESRNVNDLHSFSTQLLSFISPSFACTFDPACVFALQLHSWIVSVVCIMRNCTRQVNRSYSNRSCGDHKS